MSAANADRDAAARRHAPPYAPTAAADQAACAPPPDRACCRPEVQAMDDIAAGLGHLLLGGLFVWAGIDHFRRFAEVEAMLAARDWPRPAVLLAAASVLQIVAGLGLAFDVLRAPAALLLAGFTLVATVTLLDFWRFQGEQRAGMRSGFLANVGLLGGLLIALGDSL
jgi:putative oxidoreductase